MAHEQETINKIKSKIFNSPKYKKLTIGQKFTILSLANKWIMEEIENVLNTKKPKK